jgi:hypothetical protein
MRFGMQTVALERREEQGRQDGRRLGPARMPISVPFLTAAQRADYDRIAFIRSVTRLARLRNVESHVTAWPRACVGARGNRTDRAPIIAMHGAT